MGGFAASEDSLHLFGNVGKCILSKDGWKTDSAVPGGTRCKYKVLGQQQQASKSVATDVDDEYEAKHTATVATTAAATHYWLYNGYSASSPGHKWNRQEQQVRIARMHCIEALLRILYRDREHSLTKEHETKTRGCWK